MTHGATPSRRRQAGRQLDRKCDNSSFSKGASDAPIALPVPHRPPPPLIWIASLAPWTPHFPILSLSVSIEANTRAHVCMCTYLHADRDHAHHTHDSTTTPTRFSFMPCARRGREIQTAWTTIVVSMNRHNDESGRRGERGRGGDIRLPPFRFGKKSQTVSSST